MARIEVDPDAGSAYVRLRDYEGVRRTVEKPDGVLLDYDDAGNVVGIELIDLTEIVEVR